MCLLRMYWDTEIKEMAHSKPMQRKHCMGMFQNDLVISTAGVCILTRDFLLAKKC